MRSAAELGSRTRRRFGFMGLPGLIGDDAKVLVEGPQDHVTAGRLRDGRDEEVDRGAQVVPVRYLGELALHPQCALRGVVREREPVERREEIGVDGVAL